MRTSDVTTKASYGILEQSSTPSGHTLHAERVRLSGFTVVPGGYTGEEIAYFSRRIDTLLAEQAVQAGGVDALADIGEHETLRCCLAHDEAFVRLASNAHVLDVCRELLGDYFVLMQQNAIVNPPKRAHWQTACHRDLPYQHFVSSRPLAISALFCVDAFTPENGSTVVLPGTHKVEQFPSSQLAAELEQSVEAPAGSYLVFDSMLFHRAGHNGSSAPRRAVNQVYTLPFIAQQISMPDVLGGRYADDPLLGRLLGYQTQPARSVGAWWARRRARR
jgi:ectoine hydroxylase-related dioxygenase (phytanoyl-CoA dioxygenase family)